MPADQLQQTQCDSVDLELRGNELEEGGGRSNGSVQARDSGDFERRLKVEGGWVKGRTQGGRQRHVADHRDQTL